MNVLPLALTPKRVLLIGAGKAAAHKARGLLQGGGMLEIVAREICDDFFLDRSVHLSSFTLDWLEARQGGDLAYDIVVNATGDAALSRKLWENRRRLRYWLNAADRPDLCDFYFGALWRDQDLCVLVSTGGASPRYAQTIRDLIAAVLPRHGAAFYENLRRYRFRPEKNRKTGQVFFIGCCPGGLDRLSVKALKTLKFLDIALVDAHVESKIADFLPAHCLRISAGTREEVLERMRRHADEGKNVGWLINGRPEIFEQEASFLRKHGVATELA
jgi:uroporphyrin-III C-methyltransferase/precorrin-2 dehydrogenase/sirohydrochlorin ferrochelatase